jgi:hypothetical protein
MSPLSSRAADLPVLCPALPQALNKAAEAAGATIKGDGSAGAAAYVAGMAANLIDSRNFDEAEWTQVSTCSSSSSSSSSTCLIV